MSAPKYDITIAAYSSDSDERGWFSMDLVATGNSPQEVIQDATLFLIDQDGGEIGKQPALGFEIEHALRTAILEQEPQNILLGRKIVGTEYGPVTYMELFQNRNGYFIVHYNRHGDAEMEAINKDEAKALQQKMEGRK
jgi:hypothetical protein